MTGHQCTDLLSNLRRTCLDMGNDSRCHVDMQHADTPSQVLKLKSFDSHIKESNEASSPSNLSENWTLVVHYGRAYGCTAYICHDSDT